MKMKTIDLKKREFNWRENFQMGFFKFLMMTFITFLLLNFAKSSSMAQTPDTTTEIPSFSSIKELNDDQWLRYLMPTLTSGLGRRELEVLQKQVDLSDEQMKAVTTLFGLYQESAQNGKEESYTESLKDRSEGKYEASADKIDAAKNKWQESYEKLKSFIHPFRQTLGDKEDDFVKWVCSEAGINVMVWRLEMKNKEATAEEIGAKVFKEHQKRTEESGIKNTDKFEKQFKDRALDAAYLIVMRREEVRRDKNRLQQLNEERQKIWQRMISDQ
jgi:hypothetical protein